MRLETSLCHIDAERVVIKVQGWDKGVSIGSSLAEANTVDEAENKAIIKLLKRSKLSINDQLNKNKTKTSSHNSDRKITENEIKSNIDKQDIVSKTENIVQQLNSSNVEKEPNDWSKDLFAIDTELKRIGWDKEKEQVYLQNLYGYNNRNRITRYTELKILLMNLKTIPKGSDPQSINLSKDDLIAKSNLLLKKLDWKENQGRDFLKLNFQANSRNDLDNSQLLEFNLLLTEENNRIDLQKNNN